MRIFARIGMALTVMAAVAATTTGTASAGATMAYRVDVNHSSGTLATSSWGTLTWSTSGRTVTVTGAHFYVRGGELGHVTWVGYQGSVSVGNTWSDDLDRRGLTNYTLDYAPFSLSTDVAGGIDHVIIRVYDVEHQISGYANCYRGASTCQIG